jgi:hypothetical protein
MSVKEEIAALRNKYIGYRRTYQTTRAEFFNKTQENQLEEMKGEIEKKILW